MNSCRSEGSSSRLAWPVSIAILVPLAYALYTDQIWEDYFITFRFSKNLCEGKGLIYNPGKPPVQGFTSPLGTLLPAFTYWVSGEHSYVPAVWLFRALSLAAFAGGCFLLIRCFENHRFRAAPWLMAILYALDAKSVAFSTNGMETGFMLLFLAWAAYLYHRANNSLWPARGLAWAGLMWTRPDGCVYIASLALAEAMFGGGQALERLKSLLKSAAVCTAVYAPWFLWTYSYYGSPIPQTLKAKAPLDYAAFLSDRLHHIAWSYYHRAFLVFAPIYYHDFGGWPDWIGPVSFALALFASFYWLVPNGDRFGRGLSLCFAVLMIYAMAIEMFFPWYIPPMAMIASVILVSAVSNWAASGERAIRWRGMVAAVGLGTLAAGAAALCFFTAIEMKLQQDEVEMNGRRQIGLWLRDHARPGDRVFLEALGYIGFFSEAIMADWPGLVAPDVVRFKAKFGMYGMPTALRTEWVVVRGFEVPVLQGRPDFVELYEPSYVFTVRQNIVDRRFFSGIDWFPGRDWLKFDSTFMVFKRRDHVPRAGSSMPRPGENGTTP
jgi:hypothetical protein